MRICCPVKNFTALLVGIALIGVAHGETLPMPEQFSPPVHFDSYPLQTHQLAFDGNGNCIVVWKSKPDNYSWASDSEIMFVRSGNGGRTWTKPAFLNPDASWDSAVESECDIATDAKGRWIVAWYRTGELLAAISDDNGRNWTVKSTDANYHGTAYPSLATDGEGRWYLPEHRSFDNGETWENNGASDWSRTNGYHETKKDSIDTLALPGGLLFSSSEGYWSVRDPWDGVLAENYYLYFETSNDGADSCSKREIGYGFESSDPADWPVPSIFYLRPSFASDGANRIMMAWTEADMLVLPVEHLIPVSHLPLEFSSDRGNTWTEMGNLPGEEHSENRKPSLLFLGGNTWAAAWHYRPTYSLNGNGLFSLRFSITHNNGSSWSDPVTVSSNAITNDEYVQLGRNSSNDIFAIWRRGNDLMSTYSSNQGATWSEPYRINEPINLNNSKAPSAAASATGTVVLAWEEKATESDDYDIWFRRSGDGGNTWNTAARIHAELTLDSGHDLTCDVATDNAGSWVAAWHSYNSLGGIVGMDSDIIFVRSTDDGLTWSAPAALNSYAGLDSANDFDVSIVNTGANQWTAAWHSRGAAPGLGNDRDVLISRSTDNGATWSQAVPIDPAATSDSADDREVRLVSTSGRLIALWQSNAERADAEGTDNDILIAVSDDAGLTWGAPRVLHPHMNSDRAHDTWPAIAARGNQLVAAWQSVQSGQASQVQWSCSNDLGASWSVPKAIDAHDATRPTIQFDGKKWVLVWSTRDPNLLLPGTGSPSGGEGDLAFSLSPNLLHWSEPSLLNMDAGADTLPDENPVMASDGNGHSFIYWVANKEPLGSDEWLSCINGIDVTEWPKVQYDAAARTWNFYR